MQPSLAIPLLQCAVRLALVGGVGVTAAWLTAWTLRHYEPPRWAVRA